MWINCPECDARLEGIRTCSRQLQVPEHARRHREAGGQCRGSFLVIDDPSERRPPLRGGIDATDRLPRS